MLHLLQLSISAAYASWPLMRQLVTSLRMHEVQRCLHKMVVEQQQAGSCELISDAASESLGK